MKSIAAFLCFSICALASATAPAADAAPGRVTLNIEPQPVRTALKILSDQAGVQVLMRVDNISVDEVLSPKVSGELTLREALDRMLTKTGLKYELVDEKTVLIVPLLSSENVAVTRDFQLAQADSPSPSEGEGQGEGRKKIVDELNDSSNSKAIPEILVKGSRGEFSFNADIRRNENAAQPYVIIDRKDVARSGATNVEDLLRRQLQMQTDPVSFNQSDGGGAGNSSRIGLRGFDPRETLILVDGRRLVSRSDRGQQAQPDINGIPLVAIERIEVLPTTASGIYGGGATGGVINIILRRDYQGLDAQLGYGGLFGDDAPDRQASMAGGIGFNGGKTSVMAAASVSDTAPIEFRDSDVFNRGRIQINENNPGFLYGGAAPLGATPNIRSPDGSTLTLKPLFGSASLGSTRTFVPYGYAGPASDNGAALIANAGRFNLDLADTAQPNGGGERSLIQGSVRRYASTSLRHQLSSLIGAFADIAYSENEGRFLGGPVAGQTVTLAADAPSNPFVQPVEVTLPLAGADTYSRSKRKDFRATVGATFDIGAQWRGGIDYVWNRNTFRVNTVANLNFQHIAALANGAINPISDLAATGADFSQYLRTPVMFGPASAQMSAATLRLSGPIFLALPGGKPTMSVLLEQRQEKLGAFTTDFSPFYIQINGERSQRVQSAYSEIVFPILAPENALPWADLLELQVAGRFDHYDINTTDSPLSLDPTQPPTVFAHQHRHLSSIDPTIGLRWKPVKDVTVRASFGTGFLPPVLDQYTSGAPVSLDEYLFGNAVVDPRRGGEPVSGSVLVQTGGNPELRPEQSKSYSAGVILAPRFLPGLRASGDWTRIDKTDNVFPAVDFFSQDEFIDRLAQFPSRFVRDTDPSTFGAYGVGPIRAINTSLVNVARKKVEAIDFSLSYSQSLGRLGSLDFLGRATRAITNISQATPSSSIVDYVDRIDNVRWRTTGTLSWDHNGLSLAWTTRFVSGYLANDDGSFNLNQGGTRIAGQTYHDVFVAYEFSRSTGILKGLRLNSGIRNIFDKAPAYDATRGRTAQGFYSSLGDPRGANYYISIGKSL